LKKLSEEEEEERKRRENEEEELARKRLLEEAEEKKRKKGDDYKPKKKKKEEKKEKEEDFLGNKYHNPFVYNEGDADLEPYFKPLLEQVGDKLQETYIEYLRHYHSLGLLNILGCRIWNAIHSENWRHREAAVMAVLRFLESPLVLII